MLLQFSLPTAFVFPLFVAFFRRSRCTFRQNVYDVTKTFFPEKEINVHILPSQKWYVCIFTHEKCALWRNSFLCWKRSFSRFYFATVFWKCYQINASHYSIFLCCTGKHMSTWIRFPKLYNRYTYWKEASRPIIGYFTSSFCPLVGIPISIFLFLSHITLLFLTLE